MQRWGASLRHCGRGGPGCLEQRRTGCNCSSPATAFFAGNATQPSATQLTWDVGPLPAGMYGVCHGPAGQSLAPVAPALVVGGAEAWVVGPPVLVPGMNFAVVVSGQNLSANNRCGLRDFFLSLVAWGERDGLVCLPGGGVELSGYLFRGKVPKIFGP